MEGAFSLNNPLVGTVRPPELLGACAMTTKFLDNKICKLKILLSWRFPQKKKKQQFWTTFLSAPESPPPQKRKFYFYCRLAVSELREP